MNVAVHRVAGGSALLGSIPHCFAASWLRGLVLAAAVISGPAQAANYTSEWDSTAYGTPFANLGWRGTADFLVPDTCVQSGTADISNVTACGGGATVTSAEVALYDIGSPSSTLTTLTFDENSFVIDTLRYVGGALMELTTDFSNVVDPTTDLSAYGVSSSLGFVLHFTLDGPRLAWIDCPSTDPDALCESGLNDSLSFPVQFNIERTNANVPEPTSLWLCSLALLALASTGRPSRRLRHRLM